MGNQWKKAYVFSRGKVFKLRIEQAPTIEVVNFNFIFDYNPWIAPSCI